MTAIRQPRRITFEEYLMLERNSTTKSEYLDGSIYAMSGGTGNHAFIAVNLAVALSLQLHGSDCRLGNSDLMVANKDHSFTAYPDLSIVCGSPVYFDSRNDVLTNPRVVMEVLSPSTEPIDRGAKMEGYAQIESLRDYLLVSQECMKIELWSRETEGGSWRAFRLQASAEGRDGEILIPSIRKTLRLSEAYVGIDLV
jgi:Uma2 family endonuclease